MHFFHVVDLAVRGVEVICRFVSKRMCLDLDDKTNSLFFVRLFIHSYGLLFCRMKPAPSPVPCAHIFHFCCISHRQQMFTIFLLLSFHFYLFIFSKLINIRRRFRHAQKQSALFLPGSVHGGYGGHVCVCVCPKKTMTITAALRLLKSTEIAFFSRSFVRSFDAFMRSNFGTEFPSYTRTHAPMVSRTFVRGQTTLSLDFTKLRLKVFDRSEFT